MTAEQYLRNILSREAVDTGPFSPVRSVQHALAPSIRKWAGEFLISILPSGSFAKGTANSSGTDIDLFISLSTRVPKSLGQIYESLFCRMREEGFSPTRRNVSVQISVDGYKVDLTPGTSKFPILTIIVYIAEKLTRGQRPTSEYIRPTFWTEVERKKHG